MMAKYLIFGGLALTIAGPLSAAPIAFNFNNIPLTSPSGETGLTGKAPSSAILTSMNSAPGCSGCVSAVSGAIATSNYDPDGNKGYTNGSGQLLTLGTTDGATSYSDNSSYNTKTTGADDFIMNDDFGLYAKSQSINITFSHPLPIGTVVSYDWEIFADNTCAPCTTNLPDLEFYAGGVLQKTDFAALIAGFDPQTMGHDNVVLTAATNYLQWFDWPAEIGIDNLTIAPPLRQDAPEPSPLLLTGLGLALLGLVRCWTARRGPALAS